MASLGGGGTTTASSTPQWAPGIDRLVDPAVQGALDAFGQSLIQYGGERVAPLNQGQVDGMARIRGVIGNDRSADAIGNIAGWTQAAGNSARLDNTLGALGNVGSSARFDDTLGALRGVGDSATFDANVKSMRDLATGPAHRFDDALSTLKGVGNSATLDGVTGALTGAFGRDLRSRDVSTGDFSTAEGLRRMDPYQDMVIGRTMGALDRRTARDRARLGADLAGRKAFGSRAELARGAFERDAASVAADTLSALNDKGFAAARDQYNQDSGRRLQADADNQDADLQAAQIASGNLRAAGDLDVSNRNLIRGAQNDIANQTMAMRSLLADTLNKAASQDLANRNLTMGALDRAATHDLSNRNLTMGALDRVASQDIAHRNLQRQTLGDSVNMLGTRRNMQLREGDIGLRLGALEQEQQQRVLNADIAKHDEARGYPWAQVQKLASLVHGSPVGTSQTAEQNTTVKDLAGLGMAIYGGGKGFGWWADGGRARPRRPRGAERPMGALHLADGGAVGADGVLSDPTDIDLRRALTDPAYRARIIPEPGTPFAPRSRPEPMPFLNPEGPGLRVRAGQSLRGTPEAEALTRGVPVEQVIQERQQELAATAPRRLGALGIGSDVIAAPEGALADERPPQAPGPMLGALNGAAVDTRRARLGAFGGDVGVDMMGLDGLPGVPRKLGALDPIGAPIDVGKGVTGAFGAQPAPGPAPKPRMVGPAPGMVPRQLGAFGPTAGHDSTYGPDGDAFTGALSPVASAPAAEKSFGDKVLGAFENPITRLGLGMLASKNSNALGAFGEAGMATLGAFAAERKERREMADSEAKRAYYTAATENDRRRLKIAEAQAGKDTYQFLNAVDEEGNPMVVAGSTRTGTMTPMEGYRGVSGRSGTNQPSQLQIERAADVHARSTANATTPVNPGTGKPDPAAWQKNYDAARTNYMSRLPYGGAGGGAGAPAGIPAPAGTTEGQILRQGGKTFKVQNGMVVPVN